MQMDLGPGNLGALGRVVRDHPDAALELAGDRGRLQVRGKLFVLGNEMQSRARPRRAGRIRSYGSSFLARSPANRSKNASSVA